MGSNRMGIGLVASLFWFRLEYKKLNFKVYQESNLEGLGT